MEELQNDTYHLDLFIYINITPKSLRVGRENRAPYVFVLTHPLLYIIIFYIIRHYYLDLQLYI